MCTVQKGSWAHGASYFNPGSKAGAETFSGPNGVVPFFPIHRILGFRLVFSYENLLEKENQRAELTVQGIPILLQA